MLFSVLMKKAKSNSWIQKILCAINVINNKGVTKIKIWKILKADKRQAGNSRNDIKYGDKE